MSKLVLILPFFLATSATAHLLNQGTYRAPICGSHQSCSQRSLDNLGFPPKMNLCSCPGRQLCTEDFYVDLQGYRYSFCDAVTIHACASEEVALVLKKIITDVRCVCPETATLRRMLPEEKKKHALMTGEDVKMEDAYFQCILDF